MLGRIAMSLSKRLVEFLFKIILRRKQKMTISEVITNINSNLGSLVKSGKIFLSEDMNKCHSFNPSALYEEKNYYFNRANDIGRALLQKGFSHFAEIYFQEMLKLIERYEHRTNKTFNRGMVYGNLGIAKISQGEYDRGIAYLMAGFEEDAPLTGDHEQHFLSSPLYLQFEEKVHRYIINKRQGYIAGVVSDDYGHDFMRGYDVDNRLYLMVIVNNLIINLEVFANGNKNKYTKGRTLATFSDMCIFIEDAVKRKVIPQEPRITLKPLLRDYVFSSESWQAEVMRDWNGLTSSSSMGALETNLNRIFALSDPNTQRFLLLGAIRNFAGHNFDIDGSFFFNHIDDIESNLFGAMFYLKDVAKI